MRGSFETTNANRLLLRPRGVITVITDVETLCGAIAISFSGEAASKTAWVFPEQDCVSALQILAADLTDNAVVLRVGQRPDRVWHFWSPSPRAALPLGRLEGCTVRARVRISAGALFAGRHGLLALFDYPVWLWRK